MKPNYLNLGPTPTSSRTRKSERTVIKRRRIEILHNHLKWNRCALGILQNHIFEQMQIPQIYVLVASRNTDKYQPSFAF